MPNKKTRDAATTSDFLKLASETIELLDSDKQLVYFPLAKCGPKTGRTRKEVNSAASIVRRN